jgi:hypothetical protein
VNIRDPSAGVVEVESVPCCDQSGTDANKIVAK